MYTYIYICVYIYTYMYVCIYLCIFSINIFSYTYLRRNIYSYQFEPMYLYKHACMNIYTFVVGMLYGFGICHLMLVVFTGAQNHDNPAYGVALDSKIDKIIGLFCKRAL